MRFKQTILKRPQTTVYNNGVIYVLTTLNDWNHVLQVPNGGLTRGDFKNPTAYTFSKTIQQNYTIDMYQTDAISGEFRKRVTGNAGRYPSLPGTGLSYLDNQSYNRAYSEVGSKLRGELDLSVALAEIGQTTKMFKDLKKIVNYVHLYRPANIFNWHREFVRDWSRIKSNPGSVPKAVGGKWLEFQYGWKPLAQDLYDTAIQLDKSLPYLMKVEGFGKSYDRRTYVDTQNTQGFSVPLKIDVSDRRRVKLSYNFEMIPSKTDFLSRFTSLNPASIAWELTPWSFVVDWVYDVGGYLRNLENAALFHNRFRGGYETYGTRVDVFDGSSDSFRVTNSGVRTNLSLYEGYQLYRWKQRVIASSFPWPTKPRFKFDLGSGRLLNAAALLSQFLGKR